MRKSASLESTFEVETEARRKVKETHHTESTSNFGDDITLMLRNALLEWLHDELRSGK